MKYLFYFITVCILIVFCGCGEPGLHTNESYPKRNIVCDNLFQGNSIEEAIAFTGSPKERCQKDIQRFSGRDGLAQGKALAFANRVFKVGRTRNVEDYTSLLSSKMKELLASNDKRTMLHIQIERIRQGHAFDASCEDDFYGKCDAKYIVTFGDIDKKILEDSKSFFFPEKPTHQLDFTHFHKPGYMMAGRRYYAVEENGEYKIVVSSVTQEEAPEYRKRQRVMPVTFSGIEKKIIEQSEKSRDQWQIGITAEDNKNNIIEIVKTSRVIKGDRLLEGGEAEKVVMDYDIFKKYADVWDDMRFKFRVDFESAGDSLYGIDKSGLDYGFTIASQTKGGALIYLGTTISNIKLNKEGVFEKGKLELFSFDSIAHDGTVCSNCVYVRLTRK